MNRREAVLALAALAAGRALAQPAGKAARVGVLFPGSSKESSAIQREPFERGLRELGWKPGSSVLIDYRYADGDLSRLDQHALDLARSAVDVIVVRSHPALVAARRATSTIPIVMSVGDDPLAAGYVSSLARPGGNITGIAVLLWEMDLKRLEVLKDAFPHIRRVAVVANPQLEGRARYPEYLSHLARGAAALKLQVEPFLVRRADDLPEVFARIRQEQFDAALVRADPQVLDHHREEVAALAARFRVPTIYAWRFSVDAGGLMSYSTSLPAFHHRSATYVHRILKGEKPGELPIEQPTKFELAVNLRTAKALGIELRREFLFRADALVQ